MTVKQLRERLERVDPDMEVFVWNHTYEVYRNVEFAGVDVVTLMDEKDDPIYNEETDEYEMAEKFLISC